MEEYETRQFWNKPKGFILTFNSISDSSKLNNILSDFFQNKFAIYDECGEIIDSVKLKEILNKRNEKTNPNNPTQP